MNSDTRLNYFEIFKSILGISKQLQCFHPGLAINLRGLNE